ncbi:F-box protein CPR1-like [Rhododendron vialii]|uniref:F-box protein CPR1-like n=1 Tax=Rhododendron vialii TaxID=182163 RepID=UPI00265D8BD9|nr:F-box protein CPR1-like [Rhododendron vialii]
MEEELANLPDGIIFDTLSRLPVKPLCRFKSVSKPWLALITEPHFIKSHLTQSMKNNTNQKLIIASPTSHSVYSVDYQSPDHTIANLEVPCTSKVEIMSSCNGVMVLLGTGDELCLWNPSIRMYRKFSQPEYPRGEFRVYGLG